MHCDIVHLAFFTCISRHLTHIHLKKRKGRPSFNWNSSVSPPPFSSNKLFRLKFTNMIISLAVYVRTSYSHVAYCTEKKCHRLAFVSKHWNAILRAASLCVTFLDQKCRLWRCNKELNISHLLTLYPGNTRCIDRIWYRDIATEICKSALCIHLCWITIPPWTNSPTFYLSVSYLNLKWHQEHILSIKKNVAIRFMFLFVFVQFECKICSFWSSQMRYLHDNHK